ncbi:hypothetical protein ACOTHJ_14810 [Achromobacter xylosoxidans]
MTKHFHSCLVLAVAALASTAWASTAPAPGAASGPALQVKGASLQAGAPLLLALNGGTASEPSFEVLSYAVKSHPTWSIESIGPSHASELARITLKSPAGAKLSMDVAAALKTRLALKAGDQVTAEQTRTGRAAMVVFYRGSTPLGLVPNDEVTLPK